MKRSLIAVVGLVALIAALVVYPRYRAARDLEEKKQSIAQALAKDAAFTETLLKMELESTGVTYKELFDFCDKAIDQRNTLIVDMRVTTISLAPNTAVAVIDFLNAENGFARAKKAFFSATLELAAAMQAQKDAKTEFYATLARAQEWLNRKNVEQVDGSLAESSVYFRTAPRLAASVKEAAQNTVAGIGGFRAACESLMSKEKKLVSETAASHMPFRPVFAPYYQRSIEKANEAEKKAAIWSHNEH